MVVAEEVIFISEMSFKPYWRILSLLTTYGGIWSQLDFLLSFTMCYDVISSRRQKENEGWIFGKVLDPQSKGMRRCNRLFLLSCVLGIALDPLFLSVISINPKLSCLYVQKGNLIALTTLRAFIDFAYLTQVHLYSCLPSLFTNCNMYFLYSYFSWN